jgi:hypothetical protein
MLQTMRSQIQQLVRQGIDTQGPTGQEKELGTMPRCKATNTLYGDLVQCQKELGHIDFHRHHQTAWASVSWPNTRSCGHNLDSPLCACVKVRKTPITAEYAFQLLGRST